MDLNIDKPDLKIKEFVDSKGEKQNIEKIYKEIDKEEKVLVIDRKKDQEFQKLKNGLESHESDFSTFIKNLPKIIKKIKKQELKRTKRQTKEKEEVQLVRRVKRFSKEPITESEKKERDDFIEVLNQIKAKDIDNKQAVWEFYKSYLLALREEESLFEQLKRVDDENYIKSLKRNKRDMEGIEKNLIYLARKGWRNTPINLSKNGEWDDKDNTLLSEQLINPLKSEWENIQKEIDQHGEGTHLLECGILTTPLSGIFGGTNQCIRDIKKLQHNQNVLIRALEFKILIQLLRDMGIKKHKFDIVYENKK